MPTDDDFEKIFQENKLKIYRLILRIVRVPAEAEDLTQQVFFKALENFDRFRGDSDAFTWLYRSAVNTSLNHLRHRRVAKEVSLDAPPPGATDETVGMADRLPDADRPPEARERDEAVRRAIGLLEEADQEVLLLRHMEDLSYERIAEILKISERAVAMRLLRARKKLTDNLKDLL